MDGSHSTMLVTLILLSVIGVVGNLLSAIVWLQRHVISNNSSAVFLASLAINSIVFLVTCVPRIFLYCDVATDGWNCIVVHWINYSAVGLEVLLMLAVSVERLYSIYQPLKVRFYLRRTH